MNDASRSFLFPAKSRRTAQTRPDQTRTARIGQRNTTGAESAGIGKEMLDELNGQGNADIDNVPDDLKSDKDTRLTGF